MSTRNLSQDTLRQLCHSNLIEYSREVARWSGGHIAESSGILTYQVRGAQAPLLSGVHRTDPQASAQDTVDRGMAVHGSKRGWCLWARAFDSHDQDLMDAAGAAGLAASAPVPAMALLRQDVAKPIPRDVTVLIMGEPSHVADFWEVDTEAFAGTDFADDLSSLFGDAQLMLAPHIHAVVARDRHRRPIGAALTLLSHGVAGVYWVGTVAPARRAGVGSACAAAAIRAALMAGALAVFLHSSPAGYQVYRQLGFQDIGPYVVLTHHSAKRDSPRRSATARMSRVEKSRETL
jgi:GNAT superfamily N-acetyltransferase